MNAIVISSRQFRDRQREFLDIADSKKNRVIIRRGRRMFLITPIDEGNAKVEVEKTVKVTAEINPEVIREVEQAEKDYKNGKFVRVNPHDIWNSLSNPTSL